MTYINMPHHVWNTNSPKKSVSFQFFYQIFGFRWTNFKARTSSLGQCSSQLGVITLVFHARVTNHITIKISVLSKHLNLNPFYACVAFHIKKKSSGKPNNWLIHEIQHLKEREKKLCSEQKSVNIATAVVEHALCIGPNKAPKNLSADIMALEADIFWLCSFVISEILMTCVFEKHKVEI